MPRWHVTQTYEGDVDADTALAASKAFKAALGLAPESMRPDARMSHLNVHEVRPSCVDEEVDLNVRAME